jgi:RND family efflux transporter MFP subunit
MLLLCGICQPTQAADAPAQMVVSGLTEPFLDVTLSSPVSGIIRVEMYKEGDPVNKSDIILELDKKLEELEATRRKEIMDHNKEDMESTQVLFKSTKAVSRDEMDKRETDYQVAAADYGIASEQLARRQIKAPFPGTISEVFLHSGAACEPYQPLVRVVDTKSCYFVGNVEGSVVSSLQIGQEVEINVDGAKAPVKARICFISPVVDPASGLARVKALFDNQDGRIRPGLAAKMVFDGGQPSGNSPFHPTK